MLNFKKRIIEMKIKDVISIVESGSIENPSEVADFLKQFAKDAGGNEAKIRRLENEAEQFKDIDIAELKSAKEMIAEFGGPEAIQEFKAKAEGYEDNQSKVNELKDKIEEIKQRQEKESEELSKKLQRKDMEFELMPSFANDIKSPKVMLNYVLDNGIIVKGEKELCYKEGDNLVPLSSGGMDKLKEHPDIVDSVIKPSGGDEGGSINSNKTRSDTGGGRWWESNK